MLYFAKDSINNVKILNEIVLALQAAFCSPKTFRIMGLDSIQENEDIGVESWESYFVEIFVVNEDNMLLSYKKEDINTAQTAFDNIGIIEYLKSEKQVIELDDIIYFAKLPQQSQTMINTANSIIETHKHGIRDIHKSKEYFTRYINKQTWLLKQCNESSNILTHNFKMATAMYSRGDEDLESMKQTFITALNKWDKDFEINIKYQPDNHVKYLAVMVICDMDTSWVLNRLHEVNKTEYNMFYDDWLLHYLASKGQDKDCINRQPMRRKKYKNLKIFTETRDSNYFKTYLKQWYTKSRGEAWFGRHHKEDKFLLYEGYWNFEGAAVLKLMNADKEEFKGYKYFPYDLI